MSGHDQSVPRGLTRGQMAQPVDRATARARSADPTLTGGERRAARRALVKVILGETIPDGTRLAVALDALGTTAHQRISDVCSPHVDKHVSAADLLVYPIETRLAFGEEAYPDHLLVPKLRVDESDAAPLITAHRETAEVVTCGIERGLGSLELRREIREAQVALARLEHANEAALAKVAAREPLRAVGAK